ncbi:MULTISPECIES: DUF3788 family protein [Enterococcus]|uniref:DUF3788 family protein n=1 Tax=Enterococcus alishanensis TaxID=1303817 RepID=A0ABS6TBM7_9ENTE|nr:DUF3788 family protein [Enterococcus alishanensis]MBV7390292.1 DUF3788 family protein [Enterococcus alishanensis]
MDDKWLSSQLEAEKPNMEAIMDFLPNSQYLKILLAQLTRHYEPQIKIIFQKKLGWHIEVVQYQGLLCSIIIHDDYFSVKTPLPDFGIRYLTPMIQVMSDEFKEKFAQISPSTKMIEMDVTNEAEMEDVVFLVSLQAKNLREKH